jgi:uncharacterized protein
MPSSITRLVVACALGGALAGCFELDPFLYTPQRLDHYTFDPKGSTPLSTVDASRIEPITGIRTEDGVELGAVYVHANAQPPKGFVIFFHGKGSALPSHFKYIKRLSNMGYDVLGFDYRGFGISSKVTPDEAGIEKDSRAVLAWLKERAGGSERIWYYGHSFGGATAAQRAQLDPPEALVLESTFASLEGFTQDSTKMDLPGGYVAKDDWDTTDRIRELHAPVLFLHGLDDDYVRPEFSEKLYEAANEPKQLVLVPGGKHGDVPEVMGEDSYVTLVTGFVDPRLAPP